MSERDLKARLSDLVFSLTETYRALQNEQDDSEEDHADWERERDGFEPENEGDEFDTIEPEVIDHSEQIDRLMKAKTLIESAIDELEDEG